MALSKEPVASATFGGTFSAEVSVVFFLELGLRVLLAVSSVDCGSDDWLSFFVGHLCLLLLKNVLNSGSEIKIVFYLKTFAAKSTVEFLVFLLFLGAISSSSESLKSTILKTASAAFRLGLELIFKIKRQL